MHKITEVTIRNFKSCRETVLKLESFTALVGYNNAGKSNLLKCIDALVRGKAQDGSSFYDLTKPIEIVALLEGLGNESLAHLSEAQVNSLKPYLEEEKIRIRFFQEKEGTGKNAVVMGVQRPSQNDDNWNNPNGLPQAITTLFPEPTFINSMEDSAEDVSKYKAGNTIGKLIAILQKEIIATKVDVINDALKVIGSKLNVDGEERLKDFEEFDNSINDKIEDFFPGLKLNIDIPTPDIADLFKQGKIKVTEAGNQKKTDFNDMGHGAQRAIQMTLIRHLAEITKDVSKEGKTNLLLIDEPELFLHPQAIELLRASLKSLSNKGYQVVFTTHSPFMVETTKLNRVRTVFSDSDSSIVSDSIQQKDPNTLFPLQAALGYDIAQNLFISKKNLLVEGVSDLMYLTQISEYLKSIDRIGLNDDITIVPSGGLDKVASFISLLRGSKLSIFCLLDSFTDQKAKSKLDRMISEKIIADKNIKFFQQTF